MKRLPLASALLAVSIVCGGSRFARAEDTPSRRADLRYDQPIDGKGATVVEWFTAWARVLKEPVVVDPTIEKQTIKLLRPDAPLSWGVFKRVLDAEDMVVQEEEVAGHGVVFVHARRKLSNRAAPPYTVVLEGEPMPDRERLVAVVVPVRNGKGPDIFLRLRDSLAGDLDRIGNVLYVRGPEVIVVTHLAPIAEYYARLIRWIDTGSSEAQHIGAMPAPGALPSDSQELEFEHLAQGIDAKDSIEAWSKVLGGTLEVSPSLKGTMVKVLSPDGKVTWGVWKKVLELQDIVVEETPDAQGKVIARTRSDLAAAHPAATPVTLDRLQRIGNDFVELKIPVEHNPNDLFATVRGLLVSDVNRVANITLENDGKTKTIKIVDFARGAEYYAKIIHAMDREPAKSIPQQKQLPTGRKQGLLGAKLDDAGAVQSLDKDGPAEKAGLKVGDKVLALGYVARLEPFAHSLPRVRPLKNQDDLVEALTNTGAGDALVLKVERAGEKGEIAVVLGER
jgi:hypothetical protein